MDLRWQRADQKIGFYGLKEGIKLRSEDPNFKIDWEPFVAVNRNKKQAEYLQKVSFDQVTRLLISMKMVWFKNDFSLSVRRRMNSTRQYLDPG